MTLWNLVLVFGLLSVLGFGGGKAIIPQMQTDVVVQQHWITPVQFAHFFAISKLAPGATNSIAALTGFTVAGWVGGVVAALAIFGPSSILMYLVGLAWDRFKDHEWRDYISKAFAPVVIGLSWAGIFAIAQGAIDVPATYLIAAGITMAVLMSRTHPALLLLGAGVAGSMLLH